MFGRLWTSVGQIPVCFAESHSLSKSVQMWPVPGQFGRPGQHTQPPKLGQTRCGFSRIWAMSTEVGPIWALSAAEHDRSPRAPWRTKLEEADKACEALHRRTERHTHTHTHTLCRTAFTVTSAGQSVSTESQRSGAPLLRTTGRGWPHRRRGGKKARGGGVGYLNLNSFVLQNGPL